MAESPKDWAEDVEQDENATVEDMFLPPDVDEEIVEEEDEEQETGKIDPEAYKILQEEVKQLREQGRKFEEMMVRADEASRYQQQYQVKPQPEPEPEPELRIPEKPEPPKKPANFSPTEAFSDPNSDSAKYMIEKSEWQDKMIEWQTMLTANVAQHYEEKLSRVVKATHSAIREQDDNLRKKTIYDNAVAQLRNKYGMSYDDATDFIQKMEKPESVQLDDLVQLYKIKKSPQAQPSDEFRQYQRAGQQHTPMARQKSTRDTAAPENQILKKIIGDANKKFNLF